MKRSLSILVVIGGFAVMSLTGCAGSYGGGYYATVPPPPARYGVQGYAPGPGYVWTDGFYLYRSGRYDWSPGLWVRPPRPHAQWVPGQWEPHRRGYRLRRGYWR